MDEEIYYCDICAIQHRLPLGIGELAAGYCRLCGVASPFVGHITSKKAEELNVRVPTLEELAKED